jgi:autotransporter-associated beta strand protein
MKLHCSIRASFSSRSNLVRPISSLLRSALQYSALLLAVICVPAQAQLTQSGLTLSFDANQDQDGNSRWESYVAGSVLDMRLDPSVLRSTGSLTSGFAGITNVYVFPGSGITEIAANALGAEFSTTGSASSQASLTASGVTATTSASWEIWFRPDSLDTGGVTQVLFEEGGGTGIGLFLNDNILTARKAPGGTSKTFDLSGLTTGIFSQVVMTYNTSGALELYINGVVVPGGPATGTGGSWSGGDGAALGTRGQLNMGGIGNGSQSVANFDGDIAAFRFYSGVLSGTDVTANYNAITATTVFFDNDASDGLWIKQTNWDTNIQPTSAQNVVINNGFSVTSDAAGETANDLTIGSTAGSILAPGVISGTGALAVTGGDLTVAGILTLGDGQDGTLTLSGGILNSNGPIVAGTGATSTLTINGGTLNMNGNAIGSGVAPVTSLAFESGTLDSVSGINGTAALNKTTGGTLTLSGANTYTGATNVNEGTLVITGTNASAITVANNANLDGEGSTTGNLLFLGANHTITANTDTPAALGTSGSVDVDALDPGGFTVNITGSAFAGTIDVLTYGSLSSGGLSKFVANASLAPSVRGAILGDSGTAITYDLGYVTNTWQGSAPSNNTFWDVGTTANWSNAKDSVFQNGDDVIFDDTAARFNPNLRVNATAGTVTFSNAVNNYTLNSLNTSQTLTIDQGIHFTGSGNVTINPKIDGSGNLVHRRSIN